MKKLIIANWKMQLGYRESLSLAKELVKKLPKKTPNGAREVVLCPDYLSLSAVGDILKKTTLKLGAQDSAPADKGAYTGEISPAELKKLGVKYVILGHSERRRHLREESLLINAKIKAALARKLIPVLCVGENLSQKEGGLAKKFLNEELRQALKGVKIKTAADLVIAYEPLWTIGTGQPIIPLEAEIINRFLTERAATILNKKVRVLYGGSVDATNAGEFLKQKHVAGLLVGGASLRAAEFSKIN
jgi:triosephosphate isomerase